MQTRQTPSRKSKETISRRNLIKLMILAGPKMSRPSSLLADMVPAPSTGPDNGSDALPRHPRLFYNADSLEHLRKLLASEPAVYDALKRQGDELMAAGL